MRSFASSLLALSAAALVVAGCGEQAIFGRSHVQSTFADAGIRLDPASIGHYYLRPDLEEIVDEAFFRLQDFASRRVAPSVLRDGEEHVFVVVYASAHEVRREGASISASNYERQGLFIRGRGNVLVLVDRDRIDAAEAALKRL